MTPLASFRRHSFAWWACLLVSSVGCASAPGVSSEPPAADGNAGPGGAVDAPAPGAPGEAGLAIVAVTEDGAVAFTRRDGETSALEVLDPRTAAVTVLVARFGPRDRVVVTGKVVAFWAAVDGAGIGELGVWTAARGLSRLGPGSFAGLVAATRDGSRIAYTTNARQGRTDLAVGSTRPDAPTSTVVEGAVAGSAACAINVGFVQERLFLASCSEGATAPTIRTVSATNEVVTIAASATREWATDSAGAKIFVIASDGVGTVHTVPDNHTTVIDTDVAWAQLGDDDSVVYRTITGDLRKAQSRAPVNVRTLREGIHGVAAVSPDLSYAMVSSSPPDATNRNLVRYDVQLNPITPGLPFIPTPTTPTLLVATPTGLALGFTGDGERAVYLSDLPARGLPLGTLKTHTLDAAQEVVLARGALMPKLLASSRVVFADHPRIEGDTLVAVDVESVDTVTGRVSLVMKGVDPAFGVTESRLVYTVAGRGIFMANLP